MTADFGMAVPVVMIDPWFGIGFRVVILEPSLFLYTIFLRDRGTICSSVSHIHLALPLAVADLGTETQDLGYRF